MKTQYKILIYSVILGLLVWIIDVFFHALVYYKGSIVKALINKTSLSHFLFYLIIIFIFFFVGKNISRKMDSYYTVELKLKGVNRALKVISESNKVLVHAEEESELLQEICRIIVETGGFCFAWVGFTIPDEHKTLKIVAQWGNENNQGGIFKAVCSCAEDDSCPIYEVIKTGKAVEMSDIPLYHQFKSWQENASECGFRSALVLPLTHCERTLGVLTIYAENPNAFPEEELTLLSGLAEDLAYGINSIRTHSYHKIAEELVQEYYSNIAFLSKTIIDLIELAPEENVYDYIGSQLYKLIKHAGIIISSYDKTTDSLQINKIVGLRAASPELNEIMSGTLPGKKVSLTPAIRNALFSPGLLPVPVPHENDAIGPDFISLFLPEKLFQSQEIGSAFSISLQKEKKIFGSVLILVEKAKEFKNTAVLETFIHQASIILHRRSIEQELKDSENKFRLLAEITPGVIFIHRGENIIYANQATSDITGFTLSELKWMKFWEILSEDHRVQQQKLSEELLKGKEMQNPLELPLKKKNGDYSWVQIISKVFEFEREPAVMVTAVDITHVKKVREMEKNHQEQLMQADKMISLGNLVAGVAHEINNPTNTIIVNTPILNDIWKNLKPIVDDFYKKNGFFKVGGIPYKEVPETMADLFEGIGHSAARIKGIVDDLKNFARPDSVDMSREVDVNEVVKVTLALLNNMIIKSTMNFSVKYGDNIPKVSGNSRQLEQVFINLIRNACQVLENTNQALIVSTEYDCVLKEVRVVVADHGPGISDENLKFIMDPFFTTRREEGGTGLGLSVSSRIIKDHKGEIEVQSKLGEGTVFTVHLPVKVTDTVKKCDI